MNRDDVDWSGPMPALTTPFDSQGRIDSAGFAANVTRMLDAGATGVVACGCTGEFWALNMQERAALYHEAVKATAGRGTVIVGTGCVGEADTIALAAKAKEAGADGVLVLPPYFVKLTDDEIFAHYKAVSEAVELPIIAYNIPGNAVNAISPALADRLADLEKIVAIKESSGDWNNFYGTLLAVKDRLRVFCGPSSVFGVPAVALGADGTVDCFPNVWTGCLDLYYAARDGRDDAAELQEMGRRLTDLFVSGGRTLYPATKAAMDMMGFPGGGTPRPPLRPLTGAPLDGLRSGLQELGLL
ncbi:dihydrodipicolinate synthase family protein [Falsiroseomonas tokyonensis]|uniref:Dihydrodipicolinate synthase family protein n=1 Tax=Falsiroseomonas tokyonensis TaxID=430521 RepID=A0ABV7BX22_9PROT|nr:dihydrodipicolinate synthase family protein [Falsiroseomonas tokyonensis]MBU8538532.1 dihydrodipicolinate synthase family protein [Falsiroseomonas tokyonensis]